ncbi:hypothetical protein HPB50_008849 [Hyalomma asiaticum]|uniref:Uncharacterized protein n=1 Tax=Hyalomma asiaticum TaxID=266040 RepID=A0ACB7SWZ9_HYAAI|nr:hypothetical protein HPB50_008849 [Hyalomma asiaticum]
MFPTPEVAAKVQLGKDKVGYTICHGIVPYLLSSLVNVPYLVVCSDEALNKVTQKQQMDVLIRYWDAADDSVKTWCQLFVKQCRKSKDPKSCKCPWTGQMSILSFCGL